MLEGEIKVGDRLIWEPLNHRAWARVQVVHVSERIDGDTWIEMVDDRGRRTANEESRVREACVRDEG